MDEELPELDFGPIKGYVPPECCNGESGDITDSGTPANPVMKNFKIIAHGDPETPCGDLQRFTVNLHLDGSWSFTFTNGTPLDEAQKQFYCTEIAGAQSKLYNERQWELNGRGLGVWDQNRQRGGFAGDDAATEDNNTRYQPADVFSNNIPPGS